MCNAAETLRAKAYEYRLNADHQEEIEDEVTADDFRVVAICLLEVAEALEEDEAA